MFDERERHPVPSASIALSKELDARQVKAAYVL